MGAGIDSRIRHNVQSRLPNCVRHEWILDKLHSTLKIRFYTLSPSMSSMCPTSIVDSFLRGKSLIGHKSWLLLCSFRDQVKPRTSAVLLLPKAAVGVEPTTQSSRRWLHDFHYSTHTPHLFPFHAYPGLRISYPSPWPQEFGLRARCWSDCNFHSASRTLIHGSYYWTVVEFVRERFEARGKARRVS